MLTWSPYHLFYIAAGDWQLQFTGPSGNLPSSCKHNRGVNASMVFHMLQSTTQVANAMGLTHNVWMQGNAQHKGLGSSLMMHFIKTINEHLGKLLSAVLVADNCRNVIQLLHAIKLLKLAGCMLSICTQ